MLNLPELERKLDKALAEDGVKPDQAFDIQQLGDTFSVEVYNSTPPHVTIFHPKFMVFGVGENVTDAILDLHDTFRTLQKEYCECPIEVLHESAIPLRMWLADVERNN